MAAVAWGFKLQITVGRPVKLSLTINGKESF